MALIKYLPNGSIVAGKIVVISKIDPSSRFDHGKKEQVPSNVFDVTFTIGGEGGEDGELFRHNEYIRFDDLKECELARKACLSMMLSDWDEA